MRCLAASEGAPPGSKGEALGQMLKFAAVTAAAGAAGTLFRQFLTGGSDGMGDYLREQTNVLKPREWDASERSALRCERPPASAPTMLRW